MIIIRRPNPSPATYTLVDTDENEIGSGSIASGGSATIEAPDGSVNIRKSDGISIAVVDVLSNGTENYSVADSVAVIKDSAGTTLKSENIKATESENISISDSVAVIKDSAGTTIKTENILAQASENITINDSNVRNSDTSYSTNVKSQANLILPDSQINVNSVDIGDVVSVKTIDVNLTDGTNPVTPTSVVKVGNTLTIEVPAGASPSGVGFQMPKPSQWETFRTGDIGDRARSGWFGITQPANPKVYAELDYAAGTNGLYLTKNNLVVNGVSSKIRFRDVDGGQTFSATGNKNAVVIDTLSGLMYTRLNQIGTGGTWDAMIDAALTYSITVNGVTYDDWYMADRSELEQALGGGYLTDPNTGVDLFFQSNATQWTAATRIASSGNAYYFDLGNFTINTLAKTTPLQRTILVRKAHNLITAP